MGPGRNSPTGCGPGGWRRSALSGSTLDEATEALELLLDEHLLQQRRSGRFELHDLLRAYALDLVTRDGAATRDAALTRITSWYAHSVHNAITALQKQAQPPAVPCDGDPAVFDSHDAAVAWLADEETTA